MKSDATTQSKYVLVDFENVQPRNLALLAKHPFRVFVFVGAQQAKVPFDLANAMQALGEAASYVKISGTGKNALDFHIAYYLGELAARSPQATIYVISKDKGFDPLMKHLKALGTAASRRVDVAEIPELRIPVSRGEDAQVEAVIENLQARGKSRPRKLSTLQNTINHLLDEKLSGEDMNAFVNKLKKRKVIKVEGTKVTYNFRRKRPTSAP